MTSRSILCRRPCPGHSKRNRWGSFAALAVALVIPATGCRTHRPIGPDKCAQITPGSMPAQTGTYACQWQTAQADRAEAGKYVIHQNEWFMGGKILGPDGRWHLNKIAKCISQTPYPVVVSRSDDDDLNETAPPNHRRKAGRSRPGRR